MKFAISIDGKSLEKLTRKRIGDRIRSARAEANLSLNELYSRCGVSASTIHKIENYGMTPTVTTLLKIAMALEKNLNFFLGEESEKGPFSVIRRNEGMLSTVKHQKNLLRAISSNFRDTKLEVLHNTIEKGGNSGKDFIVHPSEEVAVCIRGSVEFEIGDEKVVLEFMDSIHLENGCRHRWRNAGTHEAEILFIFSPPLFQLNGGN
jgi:transcriptional regulator with XRE-family HTH domain